MDNENYINDFLGAEKRLVGKVHIRAVEARDLKICDITGSSGK